MDAQQAAARIREALKPIDDDGQSHGGPDGWSPTSEQIQEWEDTFHEAASPEAIRLLLDEREQRPKQSEIHALVDVIENWKSVVWAIASALNCLPSTFSDGNAHILKALRALLAERDELAKDAGRWRLVAGHWKNASMRWKKEPNVPKSITITVDFGVVAAEAAQIEGFLDMAARAALTNKD